MTGLPHARDICGVCGHSIPDPYPCSEECRATCPPGSERRRECGKLRGWLARNGPPAAGPQVNPKRR